MQADNLCQKDRATPTTREVLLLIGYFFLKQNHLPAMIVQLTGGGLTEVSPFRNRRYCPSR